MIRELTPIRFALCMMIFAHHAYSYSAGGASAVAAFFVLSGFCLTLGYKERILSGAWNYIDYLKTRFAKFYPIHWITLLAFIPITWYSGSLICDSGMFFANFFLLQSWIPEQAYYFSYNAIAWYLSTALFAYICFPALIMLLYGITRSQRMYLLIAMLFGYAIVVYAMPQEDRHAMLYVHPVCRCLDFVVGIYLAELYSAIRIERIAKYEWLIDMGLILSFVILNLIGIRLTADMRLIGAYFWLPACGLILCTCVASKIQSPLSKLLSSSVIQIATACSFSLMMWHKCVIRLLRILHVTDGLWGMLLLFVVAYAVAMISYLIIEKRLTPWILCKIKK